MNIRENTEQGNANNKERRLAETKSVLIDNLAKAFPQNPEVTNNLEAIVELIVSKAPFTSDDETRKLGYDFFVEAMRDLNSCKHLNSKKFYPHAVYHLQQAVEKTVKGYVLSEGYFKITEIKDITTHMSPLVLMKAVLERTGIKKLAEISNDETMKNKIADAETTIANEEKRIEIARLTQGEIKNLLSQIQKYRITTNLLEQGITANIPISRSFFQAISAMATIMILAIITFPHESYTRYPDGKMIPNDYDRRLGIVCEMPKMVRLLEDEINNLKNYYEN